MQNALWNLASMLIGGIITYFVSRHYYIKASVDLQDESKVLRRLLSITLTALENAKMVELARNDLGEITGMCHYGYGKITVPTGKVSGSGYTVPASEVNKVKERDNPKTP